MLAGNITGHEHLINPEKDLRFAVLPEHLADQEKKLIFSLRHHMINTGTDMRALADETGVDLSTLRALNRIGADFDGMPDDLPGDQRVEAFEKIAKWIAVLDLEDDIVNRVERRMAGGYHTISGLAQKLDLDAAALSGLICGHTEGWDARQHASKKGMLARLQEWVESDIASDSDGLAQTPTFEAVQEACKLAWGIGNMVVQSGEPGIGKSVAAKNFCRQFPKTRSSSGAVYVEFENGETTEKAILGKIVKALSEQGLTPSIAGDPKRIIRQTLGAGDLLLLDEFQFTVAGGNRGGDVFHSLHESTGIPFLLMGNATMNGALLSDIKQPFAALVNRAGVMQHMQTTENDVEAWMRWQGYEDAALIRTAQKIGARAGQSGGLRTLSLVIRVCERKAPGQKLTAKALKEQAAFCGKAA